MSSGPTPSDKPGLSAPSSPRFTEKELSDAVDQLPPVLSIMWRLLGVLQDPNSDVDDIARLIRVDTALTAHVLRMANSPYYGLATPVATIDGAIQHIGVNEIMRLVTTLSSRQVFKRPLTHYHISPSLLWQHTLAVAVGAEIVAGQFHTDPAEAYIAGLLHPIGMVALDSIAAARKLPTRPESVPLLEWEKENFGANNAAAAARVLVYWNFTADLAKAVAVRYETPTAETTGRPGRELFLASLLAEKVPAGLPTEIGLFALSAEALAELGLTEDSLSDLHLQTQQKLSQMRTLLNLPS